MDSGQHLNRRRRSQRAEYALDRLALLRRFFEHDRALGQALAWNSATVSDWRERRVVRPQQAKVLQVELLLELCEEARAYLSADSDVGSWILAPMPNLKGSSPAQWLLARRKRGLRELTHGMASWMPTVPEEDLERSLVSEDGTDRLKSESDPTVPGVLEFERMLAELG